MSDEKFTIYFTDFIPEVQKELLDFLNIKNPKNLNLDVIPLYEFSKSVLLGDPYDTEQYK